jgi:hypothetical protein
MTHLLAGLHDDIRLAVSALVDPVTITLPRDDGGWHRGVNVCLLDQLADAIATTSRAGGGGRAGGHALPICIAAVDIYAKAFDDFRAPGYTLKQSIEAIPATLPGNEDVEALTHGLKLLRRLRVDIQNLFDPPDKLELKGCCPQCGMDSTYRIDELGESVKQPALVVDPVNGAECRSCGELWSTSQLTDLQKVLTTEIVEA